MPELPEVETIRLQLEKYITGHKIEGVEVRVKKLFAKDEKKLVGGKIKGIRRFGKVLSVDLTNEYSAVIHIKLTGQLIYRGTNLKRPPALSKKVFDGVDGKHTHVIFQLDRDGKLFYNDVRKFGWIKVVKTKDVEEIDFIKKLGPEPFGKLTLKIFREIVSSTKRSIKTLLMDQSKIGGVGNIYANDALWLAKISPEKEANSLSESEVKVLFEAIKKVLKAGLKAGGASELAFVTPDGSEGGYQKHFLAYGKAGELCSRCRKEKIKRIKLGGRGTFYCPHCQA